MKNIFTFNTMMMNGTVTMSTETSAFTDRGLAEKTRLAIIEANKDNDLLPMTCICTKVEEICVYESKNDIPFYVSKKRSERLTQEERKKIMDMWLSGTNNLQEIEKPKSAKFNVGDRIINRFSCYEVVGYYSYPMEMYPAYLVLDIYENIKKSNLLGIPIHTQDDYEITFG